MKKDILYIIDSWFEACQNPDYNIHILPIPI